MLFRSSVQEVFGTRPRLSIQGWYHHHHHNTNNNNAVTNHPNTTTISSSSSSNATTGTTSKMGTTNQQYSTLQRLKTHNHHKNHLDVKEEDTEGPFIRIVSPPQHPMAVTASASNTITTTAKTTTTNGDDPTIIVAKEEKSILLLSESDRQTLQPFIDDSYLTEEAIQRIRKRFAHDSSIQLRNFLKENLVQPMKALIQNERNTMIQNNDANDDDHDDHRNSSSNSDSITSFYHWGVTPAWKLIGPPHKQRFLEYHNNDERTLPPPPLHPHDPDADTKPSSLLPHHQQQQFDPKNSTNEHDSMGYHLQYIKHHLFQSEAFYNYLSIITHLDSYPIGYRGRVRRFRPGRDYTVAHYGLLTERSVLDATLCFVKETDNHTSSNEDDDTDTERTMNLGDTDGDTAPEFSEAMELWQSGECGGFECYIEADDEEEEGENDTKGGTKAGPADEYNPDDDTELLNVSASNNTLSLVYRDPGTMRFIKYVSATAPGSRYDIAMEYDFPEVVANDDDTEDDEEEEEDDEVDDDN